MPTKKVFFVIAPENFRDEELFVPKKILDDAGVVTKIVCRTKDIARGKMGGEAQPDMTLEEVNPEEADAVIFVGGAGCRVYYDDAKALGIARGAYNAGKVVAAICAAPPILVNAGILQGMHATGHASVVEYLKSHGVVCLAQDVVAENRVITGNGPQAAEKFGQAILERIV